ncbi:protein of unknown function [Chromohalobacter canadensis]|uniref:DUF4760 domain-containing protein n=1 Tax=Chromohalobacter canadensis TaxID=141389 RepID=A0A285VRB3_9GAMM|nr:DUF4760 domain-containing protein [Chromohalobacter canadensis]SOC56483.1 protein of unknown function [Chromohalobacter canadensis]
MADPSSAVWATPDIVKASITGLALIVAVVSILNAKAIAKKKQTADLLFHIRTDDLYINSVRTVLGLHNSEANIRLWATEESKQDTDTVEKVQHIRYVLNHYERLSVGLQEGIYHEGMLKKSQFGTITKTYDCAKPFIEGIRERTKSDTAYQEFEWLAKRWEKSPLRKKKKKG